MSLSADADTRVRGYYRSNGTYVQPHYRSNPDGNFYNNWSTYPTVNPYSGNVGTRMAPSNESSCRAYLYSDYSSYPSYALSFSSRSYSSWGY